MTPAQIGRYRILGVLGHGGMGVVYAAEQSEPIRRKVALKLIRREKANEVARARFAAERRALERLDHANVARVYDAGTTDDGLPFIAMEFVPGVTITQFCEGERLSIEARLRLFIDVCRGVQHVHQKGLIHRDLKPSNILVMERDGAQIPMIIDFGIAKGADKPLLEEDLTGDGLVGTPLYVAPETLRGHGVDTRSDVYALGLVLYQLLLGIGPIADPKAMGILPLIHRLAEGNLPRPTHRLAQLDPEAVADIAHRRKTSPRQLRSVLERDLDWIVAKAIDIDLGRRYGSAEQLAADIERFLASSPVLARPPSVGYRLQKAASRHRWAVAAVASIAAVGALGFLSIGIQTVRAQHSVAAAEAQTALADERREAAVQISDFLINLLRKADPNAQKDGQITVREVLRGATVALEDEEEGGQLAPEVRANLLRVVDGIQEHLEPP